MATSKGTPLRALRLGRPGSPSGRPGPLPAVPEPVPEHPVAPDWHSPTEFDGPAAPRADLHVALVLPDMASYELIRNKAYIIRPPTWKGKHIYLHVLLENKKKRFFTLPQQVATAFLDLGMLDAKDLEVTEADIRLGYETNAE